MRENTVQKLGGHHYRIRYRDSGTLRAEDQGLWRALRVTWDGDHWGIHDDDDYLITNEGEVIAREVGWDLRREEICKQQIGERYGITKAQELWKTPQ